VHDEGRVVDDATLTIHHLGELGECLEVRAATGLGDDAAAECKKFVEGGGTVLATNLPNLRLLERLGFTITPTEIRDAAATDVANFVTDGDLAAISARFHAAAGRPPVPPA